jgi:hypothetical protein
MVTITSYLANNIKIRSHDNIVNLDEADQRFLIVWFKNNKPEVIREIFCDGCPEVC